MQPWEGHGSSSRALIRLHFLFFLASGLCSSRLTENANSLAASEKTRPTLVSKISHSNARHYARSFGFPAGISASMGNTNTKTEAYCQLERQVAAQRDVVWQPGIWGSLLTRNAKWQASLSAADIRVGANSHPLRSVDAVVVSPGTIWAKILIKLDNGQGVRLGGLTRETASQFVELIQSACVVAATEQLLDLLPIAESRRQQWADVASQPDWLTQSEVEQYVRSCPSNQPGFVAEEFFGKPFTQAALALLRSDQQQLLRFLDGKGVAAVAETRNQQFLEKELQRYKSFFDTVEKNPLTDEQRQAVVTMDDNVLAVAAAGSGKTSLLVAKAGYAIKSGQYSPEQILLLAFNRDAANELAERVQRFLGGSIAGADRITVSTFHALGLSIIGRATGKMPRVAPWIDRGQEIAELVDIIRELSKDPKFAGKWALFRAVYATSLPQIGAREEPEWWDPKTGRRGFLTYHGETVKSREERMIANWLALKGVDYRYEQPYQWRRPPARETKYEPDFYYPGADVYHEHFALDENGRPPDHFEGYAEGVAWKRKLHREQGTTLIETTSHSIRQGDGFHKLERDLLKHGVEFAAKPLTEEQMRGAPDDVTLLRSFRTFLSHVKSNRLSMDALRQRAASKSSSHPDRDALFLDLFERLWREWDRRLATGHYVDFDDMLGKATDHLASERCSLPYRLVMADEFQDTSRSRGALLRALTKADDARLFVVGDDWQAVNRFAGADISLMREFDQYFGHATVLQLTRTFRCPESISDVAGDFVMRNPFQIKKTVRSTNTRKPPGIICYQLDGMESQESLLHSHLGELAGELRARRPSERVTAQVLGRYNSDRPTNLSAIQFEVQDVIDLRWSSMHAAKGLEADYVFLVNVIEATKGMPSKIADDSTLWIAMPDGEDFPFAEERRLFYVALTRAKRRVAIYTDARRRSEFIAELERDGRDIEFRGERGVPKEERRCPSCDSGVLVQRRGRYGAFFGCSRFPRCDFTENGQSTRRQRRRRRGYPR